MPALSVIVLTSPGREENLLTCLKALHAQDFQDFEVIVADDGSANGKQRCFDFCEAQSWRRLSHYDWRPNDYCMSRSYNRALGSVNSAHWVFISSDILLNPRALGYYQLYFQNMNNALIYGYFGNNRQFEAPSMWFPERQVNPVDTRFHFRPNQELTFDPLLNQYPQSFAWGGNWAIKETDLKKIQRQQVFNEDFIGWGLEDIELANQLCALGLQISFSLDVWAEHQVHALQVDEAQYQKNKQLLQPYQAVQHEVGLLYDPSDKRLFEHLRRLKQLEY